MGGGFAYSGNITWKSFLQFLAVVAGLSIVLGVVTKYF